MNELDKNELHRQTERECGREREGKVVDKEGREETNSREEGRGEGGREGRQARPGRRNDMGIFSWCSTGANSLPGLEVTTRVWETDEKGREGGIWEERGMNEWTGECRG